MPLPKTNEPPARIQIQRVTPQIDGGRYAVKRTVGERVEVTARIFRDGHEILGAAVRYKGGGAARWQEAPLAPLGNDEWAGSFEVTAPGSWCFRVEAWVDRVASWQEELRRTHDAGQEDLTSELAEGALLLGRPAVTVEEGLAAEAGDRSGKAWSATYEVDVDRPLARLGAWYELFPRSFGGFAGTADRVPAIAGMGFDVLYLPPIHPIGRTARKGPNNTLSAGPDDPGSPWAIGGPEGGHTAIHPGLGTDKDFRELVKAAQGCGMEIALDYALQCSPDHPWVSEHPEWFHRRPDGTIACAENPPKVYQDIYPLNFWPGKESERVAMWNACKGILEHWIDRGVRIFRVDNPHTKPIAFWQWLIAEIRGTSPDIIFLSEAFTRPKVMAKLAEVGFSQSYTYFTWRTQQHGPEGLWAYLEEIAHGPVADYMRPNFWPNTPDILSGPLRNGPPAAFAMRLVLAATMSPSYGVYSGYELYENAPASDTNEEYLNSEKYEIKHRDFDHPGTLSPLMTSLNRVRRDHPALRRLRSIRFHDTTNPSVIAYSKVSDDGDDTVLMVVNLDPYWAQEATLDLWQLDIPDGRPYLVRDELSGETFEWTGRKPYVRLDPVYRVAHIFDLGSAAGAASALDGGSTPAPA